MGKTIPEEVRIKQIQSIKNISFVRWENGFIGQKSKAVMLCTMGAPSEVAVVCKVANCNVQRGAGPIRHCALLALTV